MENKVTVPAATWLDLDNAPPLPEEGKARAVDAVEQILENKVTVPAATWLDLDNAPPLPEEGKARAVDAVEQILAEWPVRTQMVILSLNLFRIVRREQNVKLLSLFTRDIKGRYQKVCDAEDYVSPPKP